MFVANMYVDVYRPIGDMNYSEYDTSEAQEMELIYQLAPIHITPFRPQMSTESNEDWQVTKIIANTRLNYPLRRNDELRAQNGRRFTVETVEGTDGAFMGNSIIYQLIEHNPVVE